MCEPIGASPTFWYCFDTPRIEMKVCRDTLIDPPNGLVWFGLAFDASLEPQPRAQKSSRLAEAHLAHHALRDEAEHPPRIPDLIQDPLMRLSAG